MNKLYERVRKATAATLACFSTMPRQSVHQNMQQC